LHSSRCQSRQYLGNEVPAHTQAGCNVLLPDAVGNTVLHLAVENQQPLMSEFLAEWDKRLLSIQNDHKQVPLCNPRNCRDASSFSEGQRISETPADAFEACLTRGDVLGVERLLKDRFNARQWFHKHGGTALHVAVALQGLFASEMIDVIMLHGAVDIDAVDSAGHTALNFADASSHKVALKQLVEWGSAAQKECFIQVLQSSIK
jgi:hypothetical protein